MFIRTPYNYDTNQASLSAGLLCPEPTRTQQQFKDETDINVIVRNFGLTGQLPTGVKAPVYGDFSAVVDFHTAQNAIREAVQSFNALPPLVRERFANDPQRLVEFCSDERNDAEMRALGLIDAPPRALPKEEPPKAA